MTDSQLSKHVIRTFLYDILSVQAQLGFYDVDRLLEIGNSENYYEEMSPKHSYIMWTWPHNGEKTIIKYLKYCDILEHVVTR